MIPDFHTDLPLQGLLDRLQREGFRFGVDTHLRIQTLLRLGGMELLDQPEQLKFLLAPVIAHNREEQQKFYQVFEDYLGDVQSYQASFSQPEQQLSKKQEENLKVVSRTAFLAKAFPYILGLLALISLSILFFGGETSQPLPPARFFVQTPTGSFPQDSSLIRDSIATFQSMELEGRMGDVFSFLPYGLDSTGYPPGTELLWQYEDGLEFLETSPANFARTHRRAFAKPGDYEVRLVLRHAPDSTTSDLPAQQVEFAANIRIRLHPQVSVLPLAPKKDEPFEVLLQLGDSLSVDSFEVQWDLAGEKFSGASSTTHRFDEVGDYPLSLLLVRKTPTGKAYLDSARWTRTLSIEPQPCSDSLKISITGPKQSVERGKRMLFQADLPKDERASTFEFFWNFGDQQTSSLRSPSHSFEEAGTYLVRLTLKRKSPKGIPCQDQATAVYEVKVLSDQPKTILIADRFPLKTDDSGIWTYRLTRWSLIVLTILATLLFLGIGLLIRYLTYQPVEPKEAERFLPGQEGPYTIPFPRQDHLIAPEKGLYELASVMRQRRMGNIHTLNVPASIHSTIQEQGMPVLRYDTSSRPNEYLILIEQHHPESHLARFFGRITEILEGEDVLLDTFYYDNDPRNCWNDDFPEGIEVEQLKQRYRKHRLIFFSSGSHFIDPYTSELVPWFTSAYDLWKENRLLLTPTPVADWSYQEKLLMEEIDVLPLDIPAQMYMMEMFDEIGQPDFKEHKERLKDTFPGAMRGIKEHDLESIAGLKAYLGEDLFYWVAATAIYPQPTWEVTLAIGHALSTTQKGKQKAYLLTFENLLTIARIPWLQTTVLSNRLREQLLTELDGDRERVARKAILHLLEEVEVRPGSLASTKLAVQETSNEFFLHPGDEEIAARMYHLVKEDQLGDGVLKKRLDQGSELLNGQTPATHLQHRFGFLRPQEYLIGGLIGTLLVGLLTWFLYQNYGKKPWPSQRLSEQEQMANLWLDRYYEQDSAILLHNEGVAASQVGKYKEAIDLLERALTLRAEYPLADTNLNRLWYHQGAVAYNSKAFPEARRYFQQIDSTRERETYLLNLGGQSLSHYYQDLEKQEAQVRYLIRLGGTLSDSAINQILVSDSARYAFGQLMELDEAFAFLEFPNLYRLIKGEQNTTDSLLFNWELAQKLLAQGKYAEGLVMADEILVRAYQDSLTAAIAGGDPPTLAPTDIRRRKAETLAEMPAISFETWQEVAESGLPRALRVSAGGVQFLAPDDTYGSNRPDFPVVYAYTYPAGTKGSRPMYLKARSDQEDFYFLSPDPTNGTRGPDFAQIVDTFFVLAKGVGATEPLLMQASTEGAPGLLTEKDQPGGSTFTIGYVGVGGWEFEHRFMEEAPKPTAMDYTPEGHLLVGYENGELRQWSPSGRLLAQQQAGQQVIHDIEVDPTGNFALIGGQGAHVWNLPTQTLDPISNADGTTYSVGWAPSGNQVVLAGNQNLAQERSLKRTPTVIKAWGSVKKVGTNKGEVWEILYSPNGASLLLAGSDKVLTVIDPTNGTELLTKTFNQMIFSAAFHPSLSQILVGSDQVSLLDLNGQVRQTFNLAGNDAPRVAFSPDGKQVIALSSNVGVQFWGIADGKEIQRFSYREESQNLYGAISISPDGTTLAFNDGKRIRFEVIPESPPVVEENEAAYPTMIAIKGGTFQMGSTSGDPDERPVHEVTLSDFELGETEVTVLEYCTYLNETVFLTEPQANWESLVQTDQIAHTTDGFIPKSGLETHPVMKVSWQDAMAYCAWLSAKTGATYRLPTEAEWEYAAGGGSQNRTLYAGTSKTGELREYGNHYGIGGSDQFTEIAPVKSFYPNQLALYDMSGNLWEWVYDFYVPFSEEARHDPLTYDPGEQRSHTIKSGGWGPGNTAHALRIHDRADYDAGIKRDDLGFRVAQGSPEGIHIVKPGETLYQVANTYGRTTEELNNWNQLNKRSLYVGQWLHIVPPSSPNDPDYPVVAPFYQNHPNSKLSLIESQAQIDSILNSGGLIKRTLVLEFWSINSNAAKEQINLMEELVDGFRGKTAFGVVDVNATPDIRVKYQVSTIPTTLILQGTKVVRMGTKEGGTLSRLTSFLNRELDKLQQEADPPTKGSTGKGAPPSPSYTSATKVSDGCPSGSIKDPIVKGKCLSCPEGYTRNPLAMANSSQACVKNAEVVYSRATDHGKGQGLLGTDCGPGQFWDPNGRCYSCPSGYTRTAFAVTSAQACSKQVPAAYARAIVLGDVGCPEGSTLESSGDCWSCPPGYRRTGEAVTGERACEKIQ